MGNEHSKDNELVDKNGTIPEEKHGNGSANGISANISSNGVEIADPLDISDILETTVLKEEVKESNEDQTDVCLPATAPQTETANLKQESESLTEPESVTLDLGPEGEKAPESDNGNSQPVEDSKPEKIPVMNFFKSLVTVKVTKKETATADATKDQVAQVSEPPAAPKGMSIPPPPPPEPPKLEIKAEPAAKPVKSTPKEEPKAAAKEPEPSKVKAKVSFGKFFRSKTNKDAPPAVEVEVQPVVEVQETPVEVPEAVVVEIKSESNVEPHDTAEQVAQPVVEEQMVEEVPQPVVEAEKVDSSKDGTLEAAAKPEPPPPVQEEKKAAPTPAFFSLFKPKVLLDHMTTKVQAASTSGVRLLRRTTGVADDPKKATPAPAAAAETIKAKEEPKAAAKSSEAAVENKPASVADAANAPKKAEKKNFFKILGQKRNSTDAGIQTEAAPVAPAAEKAK
ncbi:breast carcinoma-amplified sequence 1 isoform X2 [Cebidichthys violaceus]|uniref:breast carcinoma-amplified sequence 1 isoform X2 n=1 Tax=Cebidichthys violaceus TaxID=271503 RepID=UPI0035CB170A